MACRIVLSCVVIVALGVFAEVRGEDAVPAIYQRSRDIAFVNGGGMWGSHGGGDGHHGGGHSGLGQWGGGFYNPGFGTQFYAGTWYQRPYPYHFDYYRMRYGTPSVQQIAPDCPAACGLAE